LPRFLFFGVYIGIKGQKILFYSHGDENLYGSQSCLLLLLLSRPGLKFVAGTGLEGFRALLKAGAGGLW
jgi:hypothetical protein